MKETFNFSSHMVNRIHVELPLALAKQKYFNSLLDVKLVDTVFLPCKH